MNQEEKKCEDCTHYELSRDDFPCDECVHAYNGDGICDIDGNAQSVPIPGTCLWWEAKEKNDD